MGELVIGILLLTFGVWLASVSDYFKYFIQLLLFTVWFAFSTGAAIYVALFIKIPNHDYLVAILVLFLGALLYIPWHAIAYPEIKNIIRRVKTDVADKIYPKKMQPECSLKELPKSFAPGTTFADVEGVLVSVDARFNGWAWDPAAEEPRRFPYGSVSRNGNALSETEFRSRYKDANLKSNSK